MQAIERDGALEYGLLQEHEIPEALALINLVQPHARWTAEHFHWQFRASPAGEATVFTARAGERLVALYCTVPAVLNVRGGTGRAARVQDVMTHPDWRGRGVLHTLAAIACEWLLTRQVHGYAFPNERSQGSFVRLGWDAGARVPWWTCSVDSTSGIVEHEEPAVVHYALYDERATAIWDAAAIDGAVRRDAAYLNWRYAKPGQQYERLILDESTVLVLKKYESTVHVCDVFAPADSGAAITRALRYAQRWAAENGARTVTAWMPREHRYTEQFDEAGMTWDAHVTRLLVTLGERLRYVSHSDNDIY